MREKYITLEEYIKELQKVSNPKETLIAIKQGRDEHGPACEMKVIQGHLAKLRDGGTAFVALPDSRLPAPALQGQAIRIILR